MLKYSLKKHYERVDDDFACRLLAKVEKIEQQNILNKIIFQERISLVSFIALPLIILTTLFVFPSLITFAGQSIVNLCIVLVESAGIVIRHWRIFCYYSFAIFLCFYSVFQMLKTEH
jgi:hypothetical protein